MTAYYYVGTEPLEDCQVHKKGLGTNNKTLGIYRLKVENLRTGLSFNDATDFSPLSYDLSFLTSEIPSSERRNEEESEINIEYTQRDADDFSNWLLQ